MNILITGAWRNAAEWVPALKKMGHTVVFQQYEQEPLPVPGEWVEGLVCNGLLAHQPLERFPNLRYLQLTSAGCDRVPVERIAARGIRLHNAAGVYSIPMAEFTLCGVLQLYKHSRFFAENQAQGRWEKHRGLLELAEKNVCIIGCGDVGTACAERFRAFGCRVTGVNRSRRENAAFHRIVLLEQLDEVLPEADIVVLAVALTGQTKHLMDAARLAKMKQGAVLVNIARGALVDTQALIRGLETHLGGAVLDVFEEEPLKEDSPLWHMPQVIITPHNSFVGDGNRQRLDRLIMDNLEHFV